MTAPAGSPAAPPAGTEGAPSATDGENALGDAGKAALAAERKAKRDAEKALSEAQARLKEFEDAGKSEADKLAAREAAAAEREAALLRREVAAEKGLPADMAARLVGATKAELEADADQLKAMLGGKQETPPVVVTPHEKLRGTTSGGETVALNNDPLLKALVAKVGPGRA